MKKILPLLIFIFIFISCTPNSNKNSYNYSYQLNKDNYEDFFEVNYSTREDMANNTKKAIIRIALLDEKATFDNVIIEFSLKLFSNIDQSTSYKLSETTFKKDTPLKVEVNFSMF